jgi:hypothetical protein
MILVQTARSETPAAHYALALAAIGAGLMLPAWSTASAGTTKGVVVTAMEYATHDGGPADCPGGLAMSSKDYYLQNLPPAERERLSKGENVKELFKLLYAPGGNLGPGKRTHNQCADPTDFQGPPLPTIQGAVADGMNLDGRNESTPGDAAPNTCAHQKFTSPTGAPGIDNQFWRAMGCIRGYRPDADIVKYQNANIPGGEYTVLIELTGVDDIRNDPDVQVGIYASPDRVTVDAAQNVLPDSSLSVPDDPRYRAVAHGRIVDGVLTTDPTDVRLKYKSQGYVDTDYYIKGARLRLELKPDGTAKGMLGGYYDVETFYDGFIRQAQVVTSVLLSYTCPGVYGALNNLADAYPDAKTGKCTAISTAFRLEAIPAFIIHPTDKTKTAQDTTQGAVNR